MRKTQNSQGHCFNRDERVSKEQQWQERPVDRPFFSQDILTPEGIYEMRENYARSCKCDIKDITTRYTSISEIDEDSKDFVNLVFTMKVLDEKLQPKDRDIFTLKQRVPEHLKEKMREKLLAIKPEGLRPLNPLT
jgi:hypothetical protein